MPIFGKKTQDTASVTYIAHNGAATRIDVPLGDSVMEGAIRNSVEGIVAECGGACMCATCHVYVEEEFLGRLKPMDEEENVMLDNTACPRRANSRLGCQIEVTRELDGLVVHTPETQQ